VVQEISLSERFGLWLSFHLFEQDQYLQVVHYWLEALGVTPQNCEELRLLDLRFGPGAWLAQRPRETERTWQWVGARLIGQY
jgi:predicted AAA+ superfamily ATPase